MHKLAVAFGIVALQCVCFFCNNSDYFVSKGCLKPLSFYNRTFYSEVFVADIVRYSTCLFALYLKPFGYSYDSYVKEINIYSSTRTCES
jgi:hypothetical protein